MGLATWTVEMVKALAWPSVVVFLLWKYRQPIIDAFAALATLKLPGGIEMTFKRGIEAVEQVAKQIEPAKQAIADKNAPETKRLIDMAVVSPTGAIIEAWKQVEAAARKIAEGSGVAMATDPLRPYFNLQAFLERNELLPPAEIDMFRELRLLRNRAAHATDAQITSETSRSYVRLADRLLDAMESLGDVA